MRYFREVSRKTGQRQNYLIGVEAGKNSRFLYDDGHVGCAEWDLTSSMIANNNPNWEYAEEFPLPTIPVAACL